MSFTAEERGRSVMVFNDILDGKVGIIETLESGDQVGRAAVRAVEAELIIRRIEYESEGREKSEEELNEMELMDIRKCEYLVGKRVA